MERSHNLQTKDLVLHAFTDALQERKKLLTFVNKIVKIELF